jgi:hypothetical protein
MFTRKFSEKVIQNVGSLFFLCLHLNIISPFILFSPFIQLFCKVPTDEDLYQSSPSKKTCLCSKKQHFIANITLGVLCIIFAGVLIYLVVKQNSKTALSRHDRSAVEKIYFYQISDTHLDIYYDEHVNADGRQLCRNVEKIDGTKVNTTKSLAPYGRMHCDTPRHLLVSAAKEMEELNEELENPVEFILLSGIIHVSLIYLECFSHFVCFP